MTNDGKRVLRGFLELSAQDRTELVSEVSKFLNSPVYLQESIRKSVKADTISFAPAPGSCPCCGK